MKKILYIGNADEVWTLMAKELRKFHVSRQETVQASGLEYLSFDLVILAPGGEFSEPMKETMRFFRLRRIPFFIISQIETLRFAVLSIQEGATQYFIRSEGKAKVISAIQRFLAKQKTYEGPVPEEASDAEEVIVGKSPKIQEVFKLIGKIANSNVSVLLRGERGTGKELVARLIHQNSPRRGKPFIVIDCAAIPHDLLENELFGHERGAYSGADERREGKFDMGNGGTVFMDEIAELGFDLQSKILRVIQESEFYRIGGQKPEKVDVRSIVATQSDLEELVKKNQFREDLYHRLNVITLSLPPLRERKEDIPLLVAHFVRKYCRDLGIPIKEISIDLLEAFQNYHWPGNVRELENYVRRGLVMERGNVLTDSYLHHIPAFGEAGRTGHESGFMQLIAEKFILEEIDWDRSNIYKQMIEKIERPLFSTVLKNRRGNQVTASKILGISRNTLRMRLAELGLEGEDFR